MFLVLRFPTFRSNISSLKKKKEILVEKQWLVLQVQVKSFPSSSLHTVQRPHSQPSFEEADPASKRVRIGPSRCCISRWIPFYRKRCVLCASENLPNYCS